MLGEVHNISISNTNRNFFVYDFIVVMKKITYQISYRRETYNKTVF